MASRRQYVFGIFHHLNPSSLAKYPTIGTSFSLISMVSLPPSLERANQSSRCMPFFVLSSFQLISCLRLMTAVSKPFSLWDSSAGRESRESSSSHMASMFRFSWFTASATSSRRLVCLWWIVVASTASICAVVCPLFQSRVSRRP